MVMERLFKPVLAIEMSTDSLFIHGNHNLDHKKLRLLPVKLMQSFQSELQVQKWLTDDENRIYVLSPFAAHQQFASAYAGREQSTYAITYRWEIDGRQVALLGLNSALMCGLNTDARGERYDYSLLK